LFPEPKGVPSRTYQKQKNEKLDAAVAAVVMFIRREKQDVSPSFVFFIAEFGKDARKRVKHLFIIYNIIDLIAILPTIIIFLIPGINIGAIKLIRMFRVFRIFRFLPFYHS